MSRYEVSLDVPLKFEDIIVGSISFSNESGFRVSISNKGTESYLKELFLVGELVGVNISIDTLSDKLEDEESPGHLHIVRDKRDHKEAETVDGPL